MSPATAIVAIFGAAVGLVTEAADRVPGSAADRSWLISRPLGWVLLVGAGLLLIAAGPAGSGATSAPTSQGATADCAVPAVAPGPGDPAASAMPG